MINVHSLIFVFMRYSFQIAYLGSDYFGWQRQPRQISVQQVLEENMSKLLGNRLVEIVGCGRTDTGVHAENYFFHADLPSLDVAQWKYKLNKMLPDDIVIKTIQEVPHQWHARFDAVRREYRYYVHREKNLHLQNRSWWLHQSLDIAAMNAAAEVLLGTHDFSSFAKLHTDVKTHICTVFQAKWSTTEEDCLVFTIAADRFLRNMVRAIVGTLVEVGLGKVSAEEFKKILTAKDRASASASAPAHGLFLHRVDYP